MQEYALRKRVENSVSSLHGRRELGREVRVRKYFPVDRNRKSQTLLILINERNNKKFIQICKTDDFIEFNVHVIEEIRRRNKLQRLSTLIPLIPGLRVKS